MALVLPKRFRRPEVKFVRPQDAFTPQAAVTMTRDVNGWIDRKKGLKWGLQAGQTYFIDQDKAAEFITKGYATGELPRTVSEDEKAEWMSQVQTISLEV
jgi:hypothetical protein